jgi:hypothetical protein
MTATPDPARQLLRHLVATVAYRGAKPLRGAPASFASFRAGDTTRTPVQILAHIGDLFDWALSIARGKQTWHNSEPLAWDAEVARFQKTLEQFDHYLASTEPLHEAPEKLVQGPLADALNHIGQLTMLRRLSGTPMKGENYHQADISAGRVGADQPNPRREFD